MKRLLPILLTMLLAGCASTAQEVPTDQLDPAPDIVRMSGVIVNIKEVDKKAAFGTRMGGSLAGALIGGQIGGGSTKEILGVTGAFLGADLANEKYGTVIDHLFIEDADGNRYDCYVKNHVFKLGDKVKFTLVADHISAVVVDDGETL